VAPPAAGPRPAGAPAAAASSGGSGALLDRVVAIVNEEAVTQYDINEQQRIVLQQMKSEKVAPPPADVLQKQLLERLITERVLMQVAKETGIRVDDVTVERTIQRIAQENKLSPEEFRKVLDREGIPYPKYREDIRREITVQRVRDREVESRIIVTDAPARSRTSSPPSTRRSAATSSTSSRTCSCWCPSRRRRSRPTPSAGVPRRR
jgi:peptidyl-prolyl cis-trans isomerase SurA